MCKECNYYTILTSSGLEPTENRVRVLEIIGNSSYPLSAMEVLSGIKKTHNINKVTVYRILDLLVENSILERLSTGGRAAHFGLAPNENHVRHPHFYCTRCGRMDCLKPESMTVNISPLEHSFSGAIDRVEIRVDGICKDCLEPVSS
ncbi:MAG: transcriptional repressor [Desulfopila sp.]|nr:transcriptional repressor [Desulfopila sp.]